MAGQKVFCAAGSAFFNDEGTGYWIDEAVVTDTLNERGEQMGAICGGSVYVALTEKWRYTKAQALADAHKRVMENAARVAAKFAKALNEIEAKIDDAQTEAAIERAIA